MWGIQERGCSCICAVCACTQGLVQQVHGQLCLCMGVLGLAGARPAVLVHGCWV